MEYFKRELEGLIEQLDSDDIAELIIGLEVRREIISLSNNWCVLQADELNKQGWNVSIDNLEDVLYDAVKKGKIEEWIILDDSIPYVALKYPNSYNVQLTEKELEEIKALLYQYNRRFAYSDIPETTKELEIKLSKI